MENTIDSSKNEIQLNSKTFLKTLKKVNTIVSKNIEAKNGAIFEIKGKKVYISGKNQKSKIKEKEDIINVANLELKTSLNVKFLMDYITVSGKETTTIKFNEFNTPFILNDEYLLMPLAVRED